MISNVTSNYQTNYKPLTRIAPNFAGDKDILIINDKSAFIDRDKGLVQEALGKKVSEYTIHTALGGKEGLKKAELYKPSLTITAYNMREWSPYGVELIKELKKLGTKVIVVTTNWCKHGIESMRDGAKKCEEEAGADKYIYDGLSFYSIEDPCEMQFYQNNYPVEKVLKESVKAIINSTPIPKYPFQQEKKDIFSKLKTIFWPDSKKETNK